MIAVLKLFVAAFGAFLLGGRSACASGARCLAGVVFAFGTFFIVWLPWPLTNSSR